MDQQTQAGAKDPNCKSGQKDGKSPQEKLKMEALCRLSCKIAHDFNNILGAIEGYATLAMNGLNKDESLAQDLQEIRVSVAKAAALGKQLIAFGGRQMLNKTPCSVKEIVDKALEREELSSDIKFKVETRLDPGLPGLTADPVQLQQVLVNLLLNAREAMPAGGTAVVRASGLRLEEANVNSPVPSEAGPVFIRLSVQDNGAGMNEETVERLFEPLFSTRKKGLGSGFGLAMVYGVAKQHNGWVEVKTEPGKGSEFFVFLPAEGN